MPQQVEYPRDRFDELPVGGAKQQRIGAHRAVAQANHFWRWLLAVLALTLVFSFGGIFWLVRVGADSTVFSTVQAAKQAASKPPAPKAKQDTASQQETADVKADTEKPAEPKNVINPNATVSVGNATTIAGLAARVGEHITNNSWGQVTYVGNAQTTPPVSSVFYTDATFADAAKALAQELAITAVRLDAAYASYDTDLVVILVTDYNGPGRQQ